MKLHIPVFFLSLFLGVEVEANIPPTKGDDYFKEATAKLFENDLAQAQSLFAKACRVYKQARSYRKMNECIMAMAIIEYTKGDFNRSIKILNRAKRNHVKWCNDDAEGLKTINESIMLATMEKKRIASTTSESTSIK